MPIPPAPAMPAPPRLPAKYEELRRGKIK
jgi:hypothetical protein